MKKLLLMQLSSLFLFALQVNNLKLLLTFQHCPFCDNTYGITYEELSTFYRINSAGACNINILGDKQISVVAKYNTCTLTNQHIFYTQFKLANVNTNYSITSFLSSNSNCELHGKSLFTWHLSLSKFPYSIKDFAYIPNFDK